MYCQTLLRGIGVVLLTAGACCRLCPASVDNRKRSLPCCISINQVQMVGTHNSYHAGLTPQMAALLQKANPAAYAALDYRHASLPEQFDHGIRQIELDVYADAQGGRYAHPSGPMVAMKAGIAGAAPEPVDPRMLPPGMKVMHVQDLDYRSTCQPFTACLAQIRDWSRAHPRHLPIFILIETKTDVPTKTMPMVTPEPFDTAAFDELDREIRSVFSASEMITPDQVRGAHATLEEAVLHSGWPTVEAARGKVLFLMDQRPAGPAYLQGHPSLRGRLLFTNAEPGEPDAAFIERNEGSEEEIARLVRAGYLVRTRADADTAEARSGNTSRRDRALRSGAQIVSTDYPSSEPSPWTGYAVRLPESETARCNPVNAPASCSTATLDK